MFEEPETVAKWTDECYWVKANINIIVFGLRSRLISEPLRNFV